MGLSVTVLGCSGSYPGPGKASSGYLVQSDTTNLWLDAGVGTFAELQQHIEPTDVDAVVLTHAHVDHWLDIVPAHTAYAHFFHHQGVPVYATAETCDLALPLVRGPKDKTYVWNAVDEHSEVSVGDLALRFARTAHPPETLAVRIDCDERSLVYSSDTGVKWSLTTLGAGIDLALVEASLPLDRQDAFEHLTGAQAGVLAKRADVKRLVITHVAPGVDPEAQRRDAEETFGAPVEVAMPHARYEV